MMPVMGCKGACLCVRIAAFLEGGAGALPVKEGMLRRPLGKSGPETPPRCETSSI